MILLDGNITHKKPQRSQKMSGVGMRPGKAKSRLEHGKDYEGSWGRIYVRRAWVGTREEPGLIGQGLEDISISWAQWPFAG